jgi:alpha-L-arabinofuranosidase
MLQFNFGGPLRAATTRVVTTESLGKARIPELPFVDANGSPLKIDRDYLGKRRSPSRPTPGPFEKTGSGARTVRVW